MATIQDTRALEQRITDIVEDYIQDLYNNDDVLAIGRRCGKITLMADAKEKIKIGLLFFYLFIAHNLTTLPP